MKSSFATEINFNKVLFLHINRTAQAVVNTDMYMGFIEVLDVLLEPYKDDDYIRDLQKTETAAQAIAGLDSLFKGKKDLARENMIKSSTSKFRALMCLAERKNLLLTKEGEGIDTDAYDSDEGFEDPAEAV